jgi:hypothetical protein
LAKKTSSVGVSNLFLFFKLLSLGVSDSDDVDSTPAAPVKQSVNTATPASSSSTTTSSAHKIYRIAEPRPLTKYNFLDLG